MKRAVIPSVRVEPALREEAESVLLKGETLTQFVETCVRTAVMRRRTQAEFVARGLRSRDEAHNTGEYIEADAVLSELRAKLISAQSANKR